MDASQTVTSGQGLSQTTTFRCTKCRASYPWAQEHVGKLTKCPCGHVLKVPAQPVEGAVARTKTVKPPQPPPIPAAEAESANVPAFLRMPAADPTVDQLDAQTEVELAATGQYGEDPSARFKPDPVRDLHAPMALLVAGIVVTFICFNTGGSAIGSVVAGIATMFKVGISAIIFLIGGLIAARMSGITLGPLGPALLKLAGVSVFPAAVADLVTTMLGGDMAVACLGNGVGILTCWALVSYLFRLDFANTLRVVSAVACVKIVLMFVLGGLMALLVASASSHHDGGDVAGADSAEVAE
jgi:hypothetical protein